MMECLLVIGDEAKDHIRIEVFSYEHSPSDDPYDSNWLKCHVSVSCDAWTGRTFPVSLQTGDFQKFFDDLSKLSQSLVGEAVFSTMEEQIEFIMTGNGLGRIGVKGRAISSHVPYCALQFSFDIDQTYLRLILDQLSQVKSKFPLIVR